MALITNGSSSVVPKKVPATANTVGQFLSGGGASPLPKAVDYDGMYAAKQAQTSRDNAVRTKQATDAAQEQAYYAGANPGTDDYRSFLSRSQAGADSANLSASAALSDYGNTLATEKRGVDKENLNMMIDSVGDNPEAKQKLVASFLSGASGASSADGMAGGGVDQKSVADTYASLFGTDGKMNVGTSSDVEKAIQAEMEYERLANPGMGDSYYRAAAEKTISNSHATSSRELSNTSRINQTLDSVLSSADKGDMSTVSNGDVSFALQNDDTGRLWNIFASKASSAKSTKDKDLFAAAAFASSTGSESQGFVSDPEGNLYRVAGKWDGSATNITLYNVETKAKRTISRW